MGRRVLQPRLVAYMADDASLAYTYSRSTMLPEPWSAPVLRIKVGAPVLVVAGGVERVPPCANWHCR